jgi:predicted DNA-binding transcriptional regulator AlpA
VDLSNFPVLLRKSEVARRTGLSIRHLERLAGQKRFPELVKIEANSSGWLESEVKAWIEARVASSRKSGPRTEIPTNSATQIGPPKSNLEC